MPGAAPHLVACVASHGWGHLSQTIPIVAALRARLPALRTTVRTGLPPSVVSARFLAAGLPEPDVLADATEFGFAMRDALTIDDDASLARYRALHDARDARLAAERDVLRALRPDAVLANVGWLPIAAAAAIGVPAFGACSLNWADLLEAKYPERPEVAPIVAWMRDAYRRADALFALAPGMPFDAYPNRVRVPPFARTGAARREALRAALGVPPGARTMLVAFGGIPMAIDTRGWRLPPGWHAVASFDGAHDTATVRRFETLGWPYPDLLASVDVLVAKPGWGTFAEAGFEGRDTLVVPRDDWPESSYLVDWLSRHARVARLEVDALRAGRFDDALAALAAQPAREAARGDGAAVVAEAIAARLGGSAPLSPRGTGGRTDD